jgi:predicted unusual protein kinase regulating ubiquinone biosynthesis (AarF/ABC1/UbiB family)
VGDAVEQDLRNLKLLLRTLQAIAGDVMRQKIDTRTIFSEIQERLREELDYVNEARNIDEFRRLLGDDPEIMLPQVVENLSSGRILTMTYLDGYMLSDVMNPVADFELRQWIARKYYCLVWRQVLEFGVLHTDPNPGNYLVTYHPKLAILDFGSIRHFNELHRRASLLLARGLLERDDRAIAQAMVRLGYLDREQAPAPMVKLVYSLFEPLMVDRVYDPNHYDSVGKATEASETAFKHKLYKSPPHSVLMLRALIGLDGVVKGLGVPDNYHKLFRACYQRAARKA